MNKMVLAREKVKRVCALVWEKTWNVVRGKPASKGTLIFDVFFLVVTAFSAIVNVIFSGPWFSGFLLACVLLWVFILIRDYKNYKASKHKPAVVAVPEDVASEECS